MDARWSDDEVMLNTGDAKKPSCFDGCSFLSLLNFLGDVGLPVAGLGMIAVIGGNEVAFAKLLPSILPYVPYIAIAAGVINLLNAFTRYQSFKPSFGWRRRDSSEVARRSLNNKMIVYEVVKSSFLVGSGCGLFSPLVSRWSVFPVSTTGAALLPPVVISVCLSFALTAWADALSSCFIFSKRRDCNTHSTTQQMLVREIFKRLADAVIWTGLCIGLAFTSASLSSVIGVASFLFLFAEGMSRCFQSTAETDENRLERRRLSLGTSSISTTV